MKSILGYLVDLLDEIARIERFTAEGRDAFFADERVRYAVERCYEIIGEILKRIPPAVLEKHPEVEWKDIIRFRDYLSHQYDKILISLVWRAVTKLPALKAAVEAMIRDAEVSDGEAD
jgi:uncharacterized protein with HEPN domain